MKKLNSKFRYQTPRLRSGFVLSEIEGRNLKQSQGQSVAEYFIIMTVVLAAILATGFIDNIKGVFRNYFTRAADTITVNR